MARKKQKAKRTFVSGARADMPHPWTPVRPDDPNCGCGRARGHKLHTEPVHHPAAGAEAPFQPDDPDNPFGTRAASKRRAAELHWFEPMAAAPTRCKVCRSTQDAGRHKHPVTVPHTFAPNLMGDTPHDQALCEDCGKPEPEHRRDIGAMEDDLTDLLKIVDPDDMVMFMVRAHGSMAILQSLRNLLECEMTHKHMREDKDVWGHAAQLATLLSVGVPHAQQIDWHIQSEDVKQEHDEHEATNH
jgi:hypothetical protein